MARQRASRATRPSIRRPNLGCPKIEETPFLGGCDEHPLRNGVSPFQMITEYYGSGLSGDDREHSLTAGPYDNLN